MNEIPNNFAPFYFHRTRKSGMHIGKLDKSHDTKPVTQEPTPSCHSGWRDLNSKSEFGNEVQRSDSSRKQGELSIWRKQNESENESKSKFQNHLGPRSVSRSKQRDDDNWRKQNKVGRRLDCKNNIGERAPKVESFVNCKSGTSSLANYKRGHSLKNCMSSRETYQSILFRNAIENIETKPVNSTQSSHRKKNELSLKGIDRAKSSNVFEQGRELDVKFELGKKSDGADCGVCEYSSFTKLVIPLGELVDVQVTWVLSPVKFYCRVTNSHTTSLQVKMEAAQDECNR